MTVLEPCRRAVNGCMMKVRHLSRRQARAAAKQALGRVGLMLRPYRCPFCGGWHLTSQQKHRLTLDAERNP